MDVLEAMKKEMFRRKLSHQTMLTYLFHVRKFLKFCKKEPKKFSKKDCREFLEKFMERGVSGSTLMDNSVGYMTFTPNYPSDNSVYFIIYLTELSIMLH